MKYGKDSSDELIVSFLLKGKYGVETTDEFRWWRWEAARSDFETKELHEVFDLPGRASKWMRDGWIRSLVAAQHPMTEWRQCAEALSLIRFFIDSGASEKWSAHLSTLGRKPRPLMMLRWLESAIGDFPNNKVIEFCEAPEMMGNRFNSLHSVFMAASFGLPLPESQRGIYRIATAPLSNEAKTIENFWIKYQGRDA